MIKAYNTDIKRLVTITPGQDVTGRVIWASVYFGDRFVKTVNNVVPALTRTYATVVGRNNGGEPQGITLRVEGRFLNQTDWNVINEWNTVLDPGEVFETIRRQYDRTGYRDVQVKLSGVGEDVEISEYYLSKSDVEIQDGLVLGGDAGEEVVIPCDFTGLAPASGYTLVFEAQDIGVVGKDMLIVYNEDGYTFDTDEEDIIFFERPSFDVDESLGVPIVTNISTTSTTAQITHSIVAEATGYEYQLGEGDPVATTSNPFGLTGLAPGEIYNLRVRALRDEEVGDWSQVYTVQTEAAAPQAPQSAPVIGEITTTTNSATVNYSGVSGADGYKYRLNGGSWVDVGSSSPFNIPGLGSYSTFLLEMRAYNAVDDGPVSEGKLFTTQAVQPTTAPTITSIETTATELTFAFTSMDKVDGYRYSLNGGDPVDIDASPHTIEDIESGSSGTLRVLGYNPAGDGPWSDSVAYEMKSPPQTAPSISIEESWDRVEVTRGDVATATGYQYRFSIGNNVDAGLANPFVIDELSPETTYVAEFRAINEWGSGPWSEPVEFTTRAILDPEVTFDSHDESEEVPQGTFTVSGGIQADFPVSVLDYRVDEGAWQSLTAGDSFSFDVEIANDYVGNVKIEVRAEDSSERIGIGELNITAIDVTPPVVGALSVTEVTDSSVSLEWTSATDNVTAQANLEYVLREGDEQALSDLETFDSQRLVAEGTNLLNATDQVPDTGTLYYYAVKVTDSQGNSALYAVVDALTLSPSIDSITPNPSQISGDEGTSGSLSWTVEASQTTPEQELATPSSTDTDIVTLSNIDKQAGTADYQLVAPGNASINIVADLDGTTQQVPVTVAEVIEVQENESDELIFDAV